MSIKIEKAMNIVIEELRRDSGYWGAWEANIAMAFKDEWEQSDVHDSAHTIANRAACRFLELLTHKKE